MTTNTTAKPIQLVHKLQLADGRTLDRVTLRRGTVRDLKAAQRQAGGDATELELALVVQLTDEKLTTEDLEGMDLADYATVQARFSELVGTAI